MTTSPFPSTETIADGVRSALKATGVELSEIEGDAAIRTPITGGILLSTRLHSDDEIDAAIGAAAEAFLSWREVPAPRRGALVKRWGELLTEHKGDLATLVTAEVGKTRSEALGEVQEMIDICDLAVGQSRQLFGKTMPSERPGHRLAEVWHPLGVVGIISAFNFPVAVFAWNTALALVAGDTVVWKPADATRLSALAVDALLARAVADVGAPAGVHQLLLTDAAGSQRMVTDERVALVSATGSVRMGKTIAPLVAGRFGRLLLELGGNNGAIVGPSADLDLTLRGAVFAAAGTAGQRCTTLRRLIVHSSVADELTERIVAAYGTLRIGSPTDDGTLVGPLINQASFDAQQRALKQAVAEGGTVLAGGGRVLVEDQPERVLRRAGGGPDARADRHRLRGDLRAHPVRDDLRDVGRGDRGAQRRPPGPVVGDLHLRPGRGRALPVGQRLRLWHRQRQHRDVRCRDRRRLRRREGDRRRPGVRLGLLEGVHAPGDPDRQLLRRAPTGPGRDLPLGSCAGRGPSGRCRFPT